MKLRLSLLLLSTRCASRTGRTSRGRTVTSGRFHAGNVWQTPVREVGRGDLPGIREVVLGRYYGDPLQLEQWTGFNRHAQARRRPAARRRSRLADTLWWRPVERSGTPAALPDGA